MYTYTNGKATIVTACEIAGGGWEPVNAKATEPKQDTRAEKGKGAKRKNNE